VLAGQDGDVPLPQSLAPMPTLLRQSCLPSRSNATTPATPKKQ